MHVFISHQCGSLVCFGWQAVLPWNGDQIASTFAAFVAIAGIYAHLYSKENLVWKEAQKSLQRYKKDENNSPYSSEWHLANALFFPKWLRSRPEFIAHNQKILDSLLLDLGEYFEPNELQHLQALHQKVAQKYELIHFHHLKHLLDFRSNKRSMVHQLI